MADSSSEIRYLDYDGLNIYVSHLALLFLRRCVSDLVNGISG